MSRCDLYLENYQQNYVGGQTIVGHVMCNFDSSKEVEGILVKIKGKVSTHWTEQESYFDSVQKKTIWRTVHYNGHEEFMSYQIDVLHNQGQTVTLGQGVHKYPFTYTLPMELPTSYSHSLGKIEYKIKAVVQRSFFKLNYEAEAPFTIITPLDLNKYSTHKQPVTRTKDKKTYMCCWSRGNIKVEARVPYTAVAIGQPLPLHLEVVNLAQCNVDNIKCKIRKVIKFKATSPRHATKTYVDTIYTTNYSGVGAHGENTYDKTIVLSDPSVCPNFVNCDLIQVNYFLEITFELSGWHNNIDFEIPIMVGNIPIGGVFSNPFETQQSYAANTVPTAPSGATAPPPSSYGFVPPQPAYNPNVMPPPYSDTIDNGNFSKLPYPVYPPNGMPPMPSMPTAPLPTSSKADWVDLSDEGQNLPSYDQAVKY